MANVVTSATTCLHDLFEAQVDKNPSHVALVCDGVEWSYEELDRRANQLARYIQSFGIGAGDFVGLYMRRSERSVLSTLAVLKSGAAYVPIDPSFPKKRVEHIIEEAGISLFVAEEELSEQASTMFEGPCILCSEDNPEITSRSTDRLTSDETGVLPEDLCYVLYTSGSTGRPKGVMTEHRNVVRFAEAFNEELGITSDDRVYHGFALGFDGSVEELWMAFSNGATLVVGTSEIARIGNDAADLLSGLGVTVFSTVPTCLGMIHEEIPGLRIIIVSGEPCPPELIDKWATPQRRMLNVYGPTETTVNATIAECVPQQPVTIGRPLRGYEAMILDKDMQPVPPGHSGELYIGGIGLARGYLGQPELTSKQFVENPFDRNGQLARLYRTGDLVERTAAGDLVFHGRIDRQVKVRGYRIELSEIESVLREHPEIDQAVVNVVKTKGHTELAAYVVSEDPSVPLDRDDVLEWVRGHAPHYMVPHFLDELDHLPTLDSGKVDRKMLPDPVQPFVPTKRSVTEPRNEQERNIIQVWEGLFKSSPLSVEDDFFLDLGGYSLLAAEMTAKLRYDHDYDLSIRDIYTHPTAAELAKHVIDSQESVAVQEESSHSQYGDTSEEVFRNTSRLARWACYGLQTVSMAVLYGLAAIPVMMVVLLTMALLKSTITLTAYIWLTSAVVFFGPPLGILFSIMLKWVVIGRYKPGEYPLWGLYYFRWWLVTRAQFLAWTDIYVGSPVINVYLRLMGAKIGKGCVLDSANCTIFDLLTVGDDTSIGSESHFLGYRVENGLLKIGTIDIGSRCFIGTQSALGLNTKLEDDVYLDDMSFLPDNGVIASGETWAGSPAQPAELELPEISAKSTSAWRRPVWSGFLHFLASELVGEILVLGTLVPFVLVLATGARIGGIPGVVGAMVLGIPLGMVWFCVFVAAVKRGLVSQSKPGVYPVESWAYLKHWSADLLFKYSSSIVYPIYTTIYLPTWLRMLGMRVGKRAEVSIVTHFTPELVTLGDESYLADGSLVGSKRLYRGQMELTENSIGSRTFLGNSAILPSGVDLGDNCLVGVLSVPPQTDQAEPLDNVESLGSPPFVLPYRQKVEGFSAASTYKPTMWLYFIRYVIDGLRIVLPYYIGAIALMLFAFATARASAVLPLWAVFAMVPILASAVVTFCLLNVVAIKHMCMGTFKPATKPLWSIYIWVNELVNGVYETITLAVSWPMLGTPMMGWYLRMLGCKVGRGTFIETELFSEFDLIHIGNYAALNAGSVVQNHLFEDRIMKSSDLYIGDSCSVGNMSVVLYDSEMKAGSSIGPLSLLMKGDSLPENSRWLGIPTNQVH